MEKLRQNLVYALPGSKDKLNALICVLAWRTVKNCSRKAQRIVSERSLAQTRKRLSKLMMFTADPEGTLVVILKDNLSDVVNSISESLYLKFDSSEKLIQVAMERDPEFDAALIKALAVQLGVESPEQDTSFFHVIDTLSSDSLPLDSPEPKPPSDTNAVLCALLLRNVLNCPQKVLKTLSSDAPKIMVERLTRLMVHQSPGTDAPAKLQEDNLRRIAQVLSKDIHREFGETQKLFKAALMSGNTFDALLLDYLQSKLSIEAKPQKTLARVVGGIDRGLDQMSTWFYRLRTSRYGNILV